MSASVRKAVVATVDVDPSMPDFAAISVDCPLVRVYGDDADVDRHLFDPFGIDRPLSCPNDLAVGPTTYRFGDQRVSSVMAAVCGPEIPLERSARFVDPINAFALFFQRLDRLQLSLDARNPTTRRRFPWVDERWKSIRVSWYVNAFARYVVVEICDGLVVCVDRQTLEVECPFLAPNNRKRSLAEISEMMSIVRACLVVYCDERSPSAASDFVVEVCRSGRVHGADDGLLSRCEYVKGPEGRTVVALEGPLNALRSAMAELSLLPGVQCILSPPDKTFRGLDTKISMWKLMDNSDRSVRWMPSAYFRWPLHCSEVIDVAAILCVLLPPYVLLEIVDWLPLKSRFSRVRKVAVLEGVVASVARLGKTIPWRQQIESTI